MAAILPLLRIGIAALVATSFFVARPGHAEDPDPAQTDLSAIGGDLTSELPGRFALQLPAPNISSEERRRTMLDGFPLFHRSVPARLGLGPNFVNRSCGGCHVENGRGPVRFRPNSLGGSTMVIRVGLKRTNADGSPRGIPGIGLQLLDQQLSGNSRFDISLKWRTIRGKYPDGTPYTLRRPKLAFQISRWNPRRMASSLRMTPPVIGTGLLEQIPDDAIEQLGDPDDLNGDGISGKVNYITNLRTGQRAIGRFGFKAIQPTVEQQSLAALFNDMGITNSMFNPGDKPVEFTDDLIPPLIFYQRLAGVPAPTRQAEPEVLQGKQLFFAVGCGDCHRINFRTVAATDPELSNQTIHPFTDLLVHDMGRGLADQRREFGAAGREWRTAPLWGLGFSETLSSVEARFLHDGRARTIEEAILWHGGEGERSKNLFMSLSAAERGQLLAFLKSL